MATPGTAASYLDGLIGRTASSIARLSRWLGRLRGPIPEDVGDAGASSNDVEGADDVRPVPDPWWLDEVTVDWSRFRYPLHFKLPPRGYLSAERAIRAQIAAARGTITRSEAVVRIFDAANVRLTGGAGRVARGRPGGPRAAERSPEQARAGPPPPSLRGEGQPRGAARGGRIDPPAASRPVDVSHTASDEVPRDVVTPPQSKVPTSAPAVGPSGPRRGEGTQTATGASKGPVPQASVPGIDPDGASRDEAAGRAASTSAERAPTIRVLGRERGLEEEARGALRQSVPETAGAPGTIPLPRPSESGSADVDEGRPLPTVCAEGRLRLSIGRVVIDLEPGIRILLPDGTEVIRRRARADEAA